MARKTILQSLLLVLLSWGMISPSLADIAYYNLFVVSGNDGYGGSLYQLQVLPNGQIVDPYIQYFGGNDGFNRGDYCCDQSTISFLLASALRSGNIYVLNIAKWKLI